MNSIDVIVPCYRYGHLLHECVESVLMQTEMNIRVLIIDDASPDNTAEVAYELTRGDSRVSFVRHTANRGHIATYNEGIEWASADYLLLLSADDRSVPGALHRAADLMNAHPEVGLTFGNVIELRDGKRTLIKNIVQPVGRSNRRILRGQDFIELSGATVLLETCTAVVRTQIQKKVGGYRPELPHAGDMEMWLRFAAHGDVGFVADYQGIYRRHSSNMSGSCYYYASDGSFVYTAKGRLADLQQRRVALDCFFGACGDLLPDAKGMRTKLYRSLGAIAVERAGAAFNDGDMDSSSQLAEFARDVSPDISRSWGWTKLACKRRMGPRAWRTMRHTFSTLRGSV